MARLGITEAFARYKAMLRNPQWSVSAWSQSGELVVSLWDHHYRKGPAGTMEFADTFERWAGHGNNEFRVNVLKAFEEQSPVRLVIVKTDQVDRVEAGEDASSLRKEFFLRDELVGKVVEIDGNQYVIRFHRA